LQSEKAQATEEGCDGCAHFEQGRVKLARLDEYEGVGKSFMNRGWRWLLAVSGIAALTLGMVSCVPGIPKSSRKSDKDALEFTYLEGDRNSDNYLLEVRINGPILNTSSSSGFFAVDSGVTYAYEVEKLLKKAAKDERIKGILLRTSTPGGTVVGSNVLYDALKAYQDTTENPIYAFIDGLSASGGVWSMVAADKIFAAPGSIVGSIGVIGPTLVYFNNPVAVDGGILGGGVTTQNGIQQYVISAGKGKDLGNPFRQPTPEELQVLRESINSEYNHFVQHVAKTRDIPEQTLRQEMGAYIFGTEQAKQYKLIDDVKGRSEAITALADFLELEEDYQLVRVGTDEPGLLELLLGQAPETLTHAQQQDIIQKDLCTLASYSILVYHGDVAGLCPAAFLQE
jgi:protease-4